MRLLRMKKKKPQCFFFCQRTRITVHFTRIKKLEHRNINSMINIIDCQKEWMQKKDGARINHTLSITDLAEKKSRKTTRILLLHLR